MTDRRLTVDEAIEAIVDRLDDIGRNWRQAIAEQDLEVWGPLLGPLQAAFSRLAAAINSLAPWEEIEAALEAVAAAARAMDATTRTAGIRILMSPHISAPDALRSFWDSWPALLAAVDNEERS